MYDWRVEMNTLTLDLTNNEDKWILDKVKGTSPVSAAFNETTMIGVDGVTLNGSKRSKRNLVFTLYIEGDCEANRDELYQFFTPKNSLRLYCDTPYKKVYIDGVVETCECDPYTQSQVMQVSILCPDPQFKNVEAMDTHNVTTSGGITFPFSIEHDEVITLGETFLNNQVILYNNGRTEVGFNVNIELLSDTNKVLLYNVDNPNEYIGFAGEFVKGDVLHIDTNARIRNRATITRNGTTTSMMNKLIAGSTWIKLNTTVKVIGCDGGHFMSFITRDEVVGI